MNVISIIILLEKYAYANNFEKTDLSYLLFAFPMEKTGIFLWTGT